MKLPFTSKYFNEVDQVWMFQILEKRVVKHDWQNIGWYENLSLFAIPNYVMYI